MRAPQYRTRCYVCRTSLSHRDCNIRMWSPMQQWHTAFRLCRACFKAFVDIMLTAAREYR